MSRKELVDTTSPVSLRKQCDLLSISRGSIYYVAKGEKPENLEMMRLMDGHILEEPTAGVLTMQSMLEEHGYKAGYERVRRLMRKANIYAIYPRRHLTVLGEKKYVYPYLLNGLEIRRPNQVWQIDITYIPMANGFMYMTAIIDVYSRFIVAWGLSNSLEASASLEVVKDAIATHGKPEILNSDQGAQFTCQAYVELLKAENIQISMDGKGRAIDNIFIERFWRTIKYQHIYLNPADNGWMLYRGIKQWLKRYHNRAHQGIGRIKPIVRFQSQNAA
ncbi:MAG: IS3 family transposase [Cyanobacteria bacterium J06623_1]